MSEELQDAIADLTDLRKKVSAADVAALNEIPGLTLIGRMQKIEDREPGLILQFLHARAIVQRIEESERLRSLTQALEKK